jgi:hypothetical protein
MSSLTPPRRVAAVTSTLLLTLAIAACGGAAPSAPPSVSPGGSTPAGSPPAAGTLDSALEMPTDALIADAAAQDGRLVRAVGFFLATGTTAQLCAVSLESYPPQCGGAAVRLTGEVPADTMARLDRTNDPQLAQAIWGWVVVTGTFRASGVDGEPTIELTSVVLKGV